MQTAVRKSTRLEYKPPKLKHLTKLKIIISEDPLSITDVLKAFEKRLKEGFWIITFKVFVTLHYLFRETDSAHMIQPLRNRLHMFSMDSIKNKTSAPETIQTMSEYSLFLLQKIELAKLDSINPGIMRRLSLDDDLFYVTEQLQLLLNSALNCKFRLNEGNPSIVIFAYQLTIQDILFIFQALNEAIINILEHYFEMSIKDAKEALKIYMEFAKQTKLVKEFMDTAKIHEYKLQMRLPPINHAPISLVSSLTEYLNDLNKPVEREIEPEPQPVVVQPMFTNQPVYHDGNNPFSFYSPYSSNSIPVKPSVTNPFSSLQGYDTNPFRSMRGTSSNQNPFSFK